jgi:hypothetical protein
MKIWGREIEYGGTLPLLIQLVKSSVWQVAQKLPGWEGGRVGQDDKNMRRGTDLVQQYRLRKHKTRDTSASVRKDQERV